MHTETHELACLQIADLLESGSLVRKIASRHSEVSVLRIGTPAGTTLVAVKHLRLNGARAEQSIQDEFLTLQKLQSVLGQPLCRTIPRPLLSLQKERTIAFSVVPGVSFDKLLRRDANALMGWLNIIGNGKLRGYAVRIGEWLKAFHDATSTGDQMLDSSQFSSEFDSLLARCEQLGFSSSALKAVREAALSLSAQSSASTLPAAGSHGDFLPQNVLLDHGQAGVIDFASFSPSAPIYADVAHFVGYLAILARKPLYSRKAVEAVARQFLSGYNRTLERNVLRLYLARSVLRITADGHRDADSGILHTTLDLLSSIFDKNGPTGLLPE